LLTPHVGRFDVGPRPTTGTPYSEHPTEWPSLRPGTPADQASQRARGLPPPHEIVAERNRLIQEHDNLRARANGQGAPLSQEEQQRLRFLAEQAIPEQSRLMAEVAGRKVARELYKVPDQELTTLREGSEPPHMVFKHPADPERVVVIDSEGGGEPGNPQLGPRQNGDATRDHLVDRAKRMMNSSNPGVKALGQALLDALDHDPPKVDYHAVEQPFDGAGNPMAPRIGKLRVNTRTSS
jgi:hypothetical protein